jgi:alkanesulfonate monooxygenase SsuD/methylene tetrahydromethanopterin reductase-like flavin-dependent oxidoreductase (luciferase family)
MAFERPGPRLRDYVRAVKACFAAFRTGTLDHHGEFYDLDVITPQSMRRIRKWMWRR